MNNKLHIHACGSENICQVRSARGTLIVVPKFGDSCTSLVHARERRCNRLPRQHRFRHRHQRSSMRKEGGEIAKPNFFFPSGGQHARAVQI